MRGAVLISWKAWAAILAPARRDLLVDDRGRGDDPLDSRSEVSPAPDSVCEYSERHAARPIITARGPPDRPNHTETSGFRDPGRTDSPGTSRKIMETCGEHTAPDQGEVIGSIRYNSGTGLRGQPGPDRLAGGWGGRAGRPRGLDSSPIRPPQRGGTAPAPGRPDGVRRASAASFGVKLGPGRVSGEPGGLSGVGIAAGPGVAIRGCSGVGVGGA